MCNEYNGMTNKPTWDMKLWIANNPAWYATAEDHAGAARREAYSENISSHKADRDAVYKLAGRLRDWMDPAELDLYPPYLDILTWGMMQVDWVQLAEMIMEDYMEAMQ